MAQDLNEGGAVGDAAAATAEAGGQILDLAVGNLIKLIGEVTDFDLTALTDD